MFNHSVGTHKPVLTTEHVWMIIIRMMMHMVMMMLVLELSMTPVVTGRLGRSRLTGRVDNAGDDGDDDDDGDSQKQFPPFGSESTLIRFTLNHN